MSGVIYKGKKSTILQPDLDFIPKVGVRQRPKFEGTRDECVARAFQYYAQGARASVVQQNDSPIWRMEAHVEGVEGDPNQNIQNTHELRVNVSNPDIKTNLVLQSLFSGAAAAISFVQTLANAVEAGRMSYTEARADIAAEETLEIETSELPAAYELLDELLLGATSFAQFEYVYIHTFNFGPLADLLSDYTNVGRIFTSAQVESAENTPSEHVLPAGEWIKLPPERIDSLGQNTQLKYEYWWSQEFSRLRYLEASF